MVLKVISTLMCVLLLLCGAAATASAESVYEGTISSTFLDIADRVNISIFDDYVYYRSGQYQYTLLVGDLDLNLQTGVFTCVDTCQLYRVNQVTNGNYGSSSYYSVTGSEVTTFTVSANGIMVYSNLGPYPCLKSNNDIYIFAILIIVSVMGLCCLVRPIFNFTLRARRKNRS